MAQCLLGSGDGVALAVEECLDGIKIFYVLVRVEEAAGARSLGTNRRELLLPEADDMGLDSKEFGYFSNAKAHLIGYIHRSISS